jgi:hypothetical protein
MASKLMAGVGPALTDRARAMKSRATVCVLLTQVVKQPSDSEVQEQLEIENAINQVLVTQLIYIDCIT